MKQKKVTTNPKGFSLVIKGINFEKKVTLPSIKKGVTTLKNEKTYLMAIDKFTTQFQSKEELLTYLHQNNILTLPNQELKNLSVTISYENKEHNFGNLPVAYSNQKELIKFLNENEIKESFSSIHQTVEEFKQSIVNNWQKGLYQAEYRLYMTGYKQTNHHFGKDLQTTLENLKRKYTMKDVENNTVTLGPITHYHNIRAYLMTKIVLNEILHEIYENYIIPPNERAEYEREKSKTVRDLEIYKIPQSQAKIAKGQLPGQQTLFDDSLFLNVDSTAKTR